jgi:peptidoglycan hydrolase-like protein with peptidoglycan-binding domain
VWQAIVWADGGYYINSGSPDPIWQTNCDVDGAFGGKTRAVTVQWQYSNGLSSDGKVGAATWGKADDRVRLSGAGHPTYLGSKRTLYFQRNFYYNGSETSYSWSWNGSGYYYTGFENVYMIRSTSNCVRG